MRHAFRIFLALLATALLGGCFGGGGAGNSGSFTTAGFEYGKTKGKVDAQAGLPPDHTRHSATYATANSPNFQLGYEEGYNEMRQPASVAAAPASSYYEPIFSVNGRRTVTIMKGPTQISICRTASPNVEETRFVNDQQQIVVKSRGSHGPATVQLFKTADGSELDRVMAHEIRNNQPAWAAGMGE